MTALDLTTANAAFAAAIRPFFQAWWDCVYQSDALSGMFDRNDHSDAADEIRKARLLERNRPMPNNELIAALKTLVAVAHRRYFDDEIAITLAHIETLRSGAERAQIVAWLRAEGETWYGAGNQGVAEIVQDTADAIESGAHERACDEG